MAKQPFIETDQDDVPVTPDPTPEPRLRKVPAVVDETGLAIIKRAVALKQAQWAELKGDSPELTGQALVTICTMWLESERAARLSGKGGVNSG